MTSASASYSSCSLFVASFTATHKYPNHNNNCLHNGHGDATPTVTIAVSLSGGSNVTIISYCKCAVTRHDVIVSVPKAAPSWCPTCLCVSAGDLRDNRQWLTAGGGAVWGFNPPPPRNSEVLTKLSRIPSSMENTFVTV
jgi:hypothetical protein